MYILRGDTIIEAPPIEVLKVLCDSQRVSHVTSRSKLPYVYFTLTLVVFLQRTQWDELFICRDDVETIVDKGLGRDILSSRLPYSLSLRSFFLF